MGDSRVTSLQLPTPEATQAWGERLGAQLEAGTVVLLNGPMGGGKTTLAKGIGSGLGLAATSVTSPTYTIVHIYSGRVPVHHVDLYRLEEESQLEAFDPEELIPPEGVSLIEWPDLIREGLPEAPTLEIRLPPTPAGRHLELETAFPELFSLLKDLEP